MGVEKVAIYHKKYLARHFVQHTQATEKNITAIEGFRPLT